MASQAKYENARQGESKTLTAPITFESIREPGAYICHWSGHLLRVPRDASAANRTGRVSLVASEKLYVTRIDSDPEIPVPKARALAKETGISVAF